MICLFYSKENYNTSRGTLNLYPNIIITIARIKIDCAPEQRTDVASQWLWHWQEVSGLANAALFKEFRSKSIFQVFNGVI